VLGIRNRRTLRAEELPRDVESLAADDHDLLAVQQLLRNRAGQAAEQMALAVNAIEQSAGVLQCTGRSCRSAGVRACVGEAIAVRA
jgi:hypothetical protein